MSDLIPYGEQFKKIVDIIESAKERAYRKVNEELILMYRDIGEYISVQSENAEYGDAFVQKLADFFATNYPDLKGFNRRELYRMKQFYELYKDNEKVSPLVTQLSWTNHLKINTCGLCLRYSSCFPASLYIAAINPRMSVS